MSHYETLDVTKEVTPEQLKSAWKKAAIKFHPDKHQGDDTKMKEVNAAYDVLKDPQKRAEYDNPIQRSPFGNRTHGFGARNMRPEDMQDIFSQVFGQRTGFSPTRGRVPRNRDLKVTLSVTLEDLASGDEKHISVKLSDGSRELVKVNIPPVVQNGNTIKYEKLGDNAMEGLTRGDLYVTIHIKKHPVYEKKQLDLTMMLTIDSVDAMIGADKIIQTVAGKNLKVKIPQGTQFGTVLSMKGEGFEYRGKKGNILIQVLVKTLQNLTSKDIDLIKQIKH